MGSIGDAYDHAMAGSFFATLEREVLNRRRFKRQVEARTAIFQWLEGWYNPRRRHSVLGYLSPINCERKINEKSRLGPKSSTVHRSGSRPAPGTWAGAIESQRRMRLRPLLEFARRIRVAR